MTDYREVRTTEHEQGSEQRVTTFKITQMIWLLLGILEALIALRVLFKLIGVNPANTFATVPLRCDQYFRGTFCQPDGSSLQPVVWYWKFPPSLR